MPESVRRFPPPPRFAKSLAVALALHVGLLVTIRFSRDGQPPTARPVEPQWVELDVHVDEGRRAVRGGEAAQPESPSNESSSPSPSAARRGKIGASQPETPASEGDEGDLAEGVARGAEVSSGEAGGEGDEGSREPGFDVLEHLFSRRPLLEPQAAPVPDPGQRLQESLHRDLARSDAKVGLGPGPQLAARLRTIARKVSPQNSTVTCQIDVDRSGKATRIVLLSASSSTEHWRRALQELRRMLERYRVSGGPARVTLRIRNKSARPSGARGVSPEVSGRGAGAQFDLSDITGPWMQHLDVEVLDQVPL